MIDIKRELEIAKEKRKDLELQLKVEKDFMKNIKSFGCYSLDKQFNHIKKTELQLLNINNRIALLGGMRND